MSASDKEQLEPRLAKCGHVAYRNHDNLCVEDGCPRAAYRNWSQPSEPAAGREPLNLDHDESRALHRIVRAMHDGECPKCHTVHDSRSMRYGDHGRLATDPPGCGWLCRTCGFFVTHSEADEVFRIFAPFMERNLAIFEEWRNSRERK